MCDRGVPVATAQMLPEWVTLRFGSNQAEYARYTSPTVSGKLSYGSALQRPVKVYVISKLRDRVEVYTQNKQKLSVSNINSRKIC